MSFVKVLPKYFIPYDGIVNAILNFIFRLFIANV